MTRDEDDEWDEELDGDGDDDSDGEPTVPCPYCRREVLEDSSWCPSCDRYLTAEDFNRDGRPVWFVVAALICLGVAIWWAVAPR